MGLRKNLGFFLLKDKYVGSYTDVAGTIATLRLLKPSNLGVDLVRIGGMGDGGYLVPNDLEGVTHCFSPGVSTVANFESELANKFNVSSFLADASVDSPPLASSRIVFEKKFIGSQDDENFMRLTSWMESKRSEIGTSDLMLQMDIEGAEYAVLIDTDLNILKQFRIMVIEFHDLDNIFSRSAANLYRALFLKIGHIFSVCHIHINNCFPSTVRNGIAIPRVVEVTYLRNDRVRRRGPLIGLPHPLDQRNVESNPDIPVPRYWIT